MSLYNITVMTDLDPSVDYTMGLDFVRAISNVNQYDVSHINHKKLYERFGPIKFCSELFRLVSDNKTDILLWTADADYEFEIGFLGDLFRSVFSVLYVGDDEHYFDKNTRYYAQVFDLVIASNPYTIYRYRLYGIDAVPYYSSYDTTKIKKIEFFDEFNDPVSFVGVIKNKVGRKDYLDFLSQNRVDVSVYGYGSENGVVTREEMISIFSRTKINLSFSGVATKGPLDYDIKINQRIKQIKGRCQEIALAGGFVLAEYAPGIDSLFDVGVGKEIDVFHNRQELLDKISYYLDNDNVRNDMAKKAHQRALIDYDEVNQWRGYIELISSRIDNPGPENDFLGVYEDKIFKKSYSAYHLSYVFFFLSKLKFSNAFDEVRVVLKYPLIDFWVFWFFMKRHIICHPVMGKVVRILRR